MPGKPLSTFLRLTRLLWVGLWLAGFTSAVLAQSDTNCASVDTNVFYPSSPLCYPLTSDQYAVQYKVGNGDWTNARVYISYYGATLASPFSVTSGYISNKTSMSFVSIPASANTDVYLRVTNLNAGFVAGDHVSVRPGSKPVSATVAGDGTASLQTRTAPDFNGEQFLLWWSDGTNGGSIESLVFFLDPPYVAPTNGNIMTITNYLQLTNLNHFDTLIFQGKVTVGGTGDQVYEVPAGVTNIYLAPGAWVQGKLFFKYGNGVSKRIYGPGVLDGSRFNYADRTCSDDQGAEFLSFANTPNASTNPADTYQLDGFIISDHNHALNNPLFNSTVNNVKSLGWNPINGGFRLNDNTAVSNVFIRACDDSLMMWGTNITVRNATVWQNYNGGVVNLGWNDNSQGDGCLIDGLYVVKTEWQTPTGPGFNKQKLDGQNNAVIASLMVPGTMFGRLSPPVFRNILIEDPPNVLLSLKILFPECDDPDNPRYGNCASVDLTLPSVLDLDIENLCTPASIQPNAIGFLNIQTNFTYDFPSNIVNTVTNEFTLAGSMNIGLTNVFIQSTNGIMNPLSRANAAAVGNFIMNGTNINVAYGFNPSPCLSCLPQLTILFARGNAVIIWPTNFPGFSLQQATNLTASTVWITNATAPVIVNGLNVVTNPIASKHQFYRLAQ